ncbi:hypothetical protein [Desulfosarcina cetonica]|uniref:hypothetical protein n=1 Tax=Desulfosarcina cetonica TaxID=90730 RepID=UPI001FEE9893|nr:hypothetical protein [Desulfosarcina cetonica]
MGDTVKIGHLIGDRQGRAAVSRRENGDFGPQQTHEGIALNMRIDGGFAVFSGI